MALYGTCKTCGGETRDYLCANCLLRENERLREEVARLSAATPPLPVIHTSTGEIITGPDGKVISDTTHPGPAKSEPDKVQMPGADRNTNVGTIQPKYDITTQSGH